MMDDRTTPEIERLTGLLYDAEVSERRIKSLSSVIENTAWMKIKLDDAREAIKSSNVVIPYDNGGGQSGIRENPLFKGYESLFKTYMQGMDRILNALPAEKVKEVEQEIEKPQTVLELVRNKHKKEA